MCCKGNKEIRDAKIFARLAALILSYCEVDFFTTENTEVTEIELLLWRLQEETMASTIRRKASAQRANAIVFIAQPIWEVPWHLLINALFIIIPLCPLCSLCFNHTGRKILAFASDLWSSGPCCLLTFELLVKPRDFEIIGIVKELLDKKSRQKLTKIFLFKKNVVSSQRIRCLSNGKVLQYSRSEQVGHSL